MITFEGGGSTERTGLEQTISVGININQLKTKLIIESVLNRRLMPTKETQIISRQLAAAIVGYSITRSRVW